MSVASEFDRNFVGRYCYFRLPKLGHSRAGTPLYLKSLDPDKCRNFSHQHFIERLRKLRDPTKLRDI